jgi:tubulin-folding cofactor B
MELRYNGMEMEDGKTLGYYCVRNNDVIDVIDHDPDSVAANGGLDDVSQVERYVMSDEDYDKRPNTYRAFKAQQLKENPNWIPPWEVKARERRAAELAANPLESLESVQDRVKVDMRCECFPGGRRGAVKYVGYFGNGPRTYPDGYVEPAQVWVGVQFDEPVGKNDGSFKGKRYFTCEKSYGGFLKPDFVRVGDFPEKDPFASDNEEEAAAEEGEDVMEEL